VYRIDTDRVPRTKLERATRLTSFAAMMARLAWASTFSLRRSLMTFPSNPLSNENRHPMNNALAATAVGG
jgi:hypothetical protein